MVEGVEIMCGGISANGVADLIARFPALRQLVMPGAVQDGDMLSDGPSLLRAAPDAVAAILAAGTGHYGELDHEIAAAALPIQAQMDLLAKIMELTLPDGIVPFVAKLTSMFAGAADLPPSNAGLSTYEPLPNGKAQDTSSL